MLRKKLFCLTAMLGLSVTSVATACDRPAYRTVTVITLENRQVPVTIWQTVCDDYGQSRRFAVTVLRTVQVPVEHFVRVAY